MRTTGRASHRRAAAAIGSIALLVALAAWYARPIVQVRRIGISWGAVRHAHCSRGTSEIFCTTNWPSTAGRNPYATVQFSPHTRGVRRADRVWRLADSGAWIRLIDSTREALATAKSSPLPCDPTVTGFPIAEAWHAGTYELRLYAAPRIPARSRDMRWFVTVQLLPFGTYGCGPRYRRRLLTPAELARAARDWLATQLGLN